MSISDPLSRIRKVLGTHDVPATQIPIWQVIVAVGKFERYRGLQVTTIDIVGMGSAPDKIQIVTHDTYQGETRISRFLVAGHDQMPTLLCGLMDAETRIANLEATDRASWPPMPLVVAVAEGEMGAIKAVVGFYKEKLEIILTKGSAGGGNGQWVKWGLQDNRAAMQILLQAYDRITTSAPESVPEGESGIPF